MGSVMAGGAAAGGMGGMGDLLMGSAKHKGDAPLMTKEQQDYLAQMLQGMGPQANQALQGLLGSADPAQMQSMFQQSFVDPAMMAFEQQALPAIQQRFVDANAGSSSALNQALGQSAADLSTMIGSQIGNFYQQQQGNQMGAMDLLNQSLGQRAFDPIIQKREGILGPLISAGGQMGAAAMSSREIKENIKECKEGLDVINTLNVKKYDYKEDSPVSGKDKIGFIAEDVPKDIQQEIYGVLGVDIYGLLAISVNAIKELSKRVEELEAV